MSNPVEPVIAGSRGFALALLAPLTERIGMRPRIAADPVRARAFCGGAGGLVVVEFLGGDTLQAIRELVHDAKGVRVVAAVPEKLASADASLRALGVDVARWDGTATSVVAAVGRQLATVASQASPPAGGTATAPPSTPAPPAPAAHAPVAEASPPPQTASARATSRPPTAASVPARAPAPAPAAERPPPRAHEAPPSPGVPKATPAARVAPVPVVAEPRAPALATSPAPSAAVPVFGIRRTPVPATASTLAAEPRAVEQPAPAVLVAERRTPAAPAAVEPAWPATIPSQADAAEALDRATAGLPPTAAVVSEVIAALSDLERVVLAGGEVPVDPEPIRQAAVMRVRVAAALATVPPQGGAVDGEAMSALLAEIDALLGRVSALAAGATPELAPALEAVRNALVREAIDFSEAAQRVSAGAATGEAVRSQPARAAQTRLVSIDRAPEISRRRSAARWIALAVAIVLGGAYHGWSWYVRQSARAKLTAGLPAGLTQIPGPPGGPRVIVRATTTTVPDAGDVARLKAAEEARGNIVRESDGMIFIEPAPPSDKATAGSGPKP